MHIRNVIARIEQTAPPKAAMAWDKCGVQIAGLKTRIRKFAVTLDPVPEIIEQTLDWGADIILTHHPLSIEPRHLDKVDSYHKAASLILKSGSWLFASHTSLDANPRGPAGKLARDLNLSDLRVIEETYRRRFIRVEFRTAKQLPDSLAQLGVTDISVKTDGDRVLLTCALDEWEKLKSNLLGFADESQGFHITEAVCPDVVFGIGFIGNLPAELPFSDFKKLLAQTLPKDFWVLYGPEPKTVSTVGYCTGSGGTLAGKAQAKSADVYITGEMKYHPALETKIPIIDVGHFSLEEEMMKDFHHVLADDAELKDIELRYFPGSDPQRVVVPEK